MKAMLLIAVNYVREQRWPIFVLMLWILLLAFLGLIAKIPRDREELMYLFKQVAMYAVVFSIFFGGTAIHNERRTRRILAVLSKAISREQYLSGLVLGVTLACGLYCLSLGITGSWTLGQAGFPISQVWFLMLCLIAACMLAGTVALMFSTFLNPFFGASATAIVLLGLPAVAGHFMTPAWESVLPVYALTMTVMKSSFTDPGNAVWFPIGLAVLETVAFWVLAARIFAYVDIAVALE
jgi:ABC-type transport system involved in multi-copper enzyme maturation permease subunit